MKIDKVTMAKMHKIQMEMLLDLISVMDKLKIHYFFVHGSLLGAVRDGNFIIEDDDIDIALFREDYNKLFSYGTDLIKKNYFLQNSATDTFPLPFGKMRNTNTTFIQNVLSNVDCNQGIYIDIFPIDYENHHLYFALKKKLLDFRCNSALNLSKNSLKKRFFSNIAKLFFPSLTTALLKREALYSSLKKKNKVAIYGGKPTERNMDISWFKNYSTHSFAGAEVMCPAMYKDYLERIYGKDYMNYNPAIDRIDEENIEISAEVLDFEKSYRFYK